MEKDTQGRKWQVTINNPADKQADHDKLKLVLESLKTVYWCMADEIGLETQTPHTHLYVQTKTAIRFSRMKKMFPDAHIERAHGTAEQNRDYVAKSGKWEDDAKSDTRVDGTFEESGELPEEVGQGHRSDLDEIAALIEDGMNPADIMADNFAYRKYERMIRAAYFAKRKRETPVKRDLAVHYICGDSGSGKSYTYVTLCDERGENDIYFLSDYDGGGFDNYCGEPILFMDEYKGQFRFSQFLIITDVYKAQIHARYSNVVALWSEIYITSVFPPEELYKRMVEEGNRGIDKQQQLFRRITDITYCFKDANGEYRRYTIPMSQYHDYEELRYAANEHFKPEQMTIETAAPKFEIIEDDGDLPF